MTTVTSEGVRCSDWARAEGLDPVGSAGCYRGFLLVEWPLPWPRDLSEIEGLRGVAVLAREAGFRLQGLIPTGGARRVIAYVDSRSDGFFAGFARLEAPAGDDLAATVASLLDQRVSPSGPPGGRDLLVCTHGRRDVCCGSLGTRLSVRLDDVPLPADVRRWRTSHTGGHRFAPTFIVLPEATMWAYGDSDLVQRVLGRQGDAALVADRYRGCAGLPSPAVQALEREVLRRIGWGLLDRPRRGVELDGGRLRLEVGGDGGPAAEAWEADVGPGRLLPVPDCGRPIGEAKKSEHEWVVSSVRQV
jgi:hypothetical protein